MKPNDLLFRNLGVRRGLACWCSLVIDTSSGTPPMLLPPSLVGATCKTEALSRIDPTKECCRHCYCPPLNFAPLALSENKYRFRCSNWGTCESVSILSLPITNSSIERGSFGGAWEYKSMHKMVGWAISTTECEVKGQVYATSSLSTCNAPILSADREDVISSISYCTPLSSGMGMTGLSPILRAFRFRLEIGNLQWSWNRQ